MVAGQQGELGHAQLGLGRHERDAGGRQFLDGGPGGAGRLGQQAQLHQCVRVLDVMLAERQASGLVPLRRLLEQDQARGETSRLNSHPRPALGEQGEQRRADVRGRWQSLPEPLQGSTITASLRLDQCQVVRGQHQVPRAGRGVAQHPVVDGGGIGQLPDVLQQDGLIEVQFTGAGAGEQRGRGAQVTARGRHPAEFLADRSMGHQQVSQRVVQMMPARDPAGLVE